MDKKMPFILRYGLASTVSNLIFSGKCLANYSECIINCSVLSTGKYGIFMEVIELINKKAELKKTDT